jgi:hypothetical protein
MVITAEQKARKRAQKALEEGKKFQSRGAANKKILEEVRAEVAGEGRRQQKIVQQTANRAVHRIEDAGQKEIEKIDGYAREAVERALGGGAAAPSASASCSPEKLDAALLCGCMAAEPPAHEVCMTEEDVHMAAELCTEPPLPERRVVPRLTLPEPQGPPSMLSPQPTMFQGTPRELSPAQPEALEMALVRTTPRDYHPDQQALQNELDEYKEIIHRIDQATKAKNAEMERLRPELDEVYERTLDRLSELQGWPSAQKFRNAILMRVQWFFARAAYKTELRDKLLECEVAPALSKKRKACSRCLPLEELRFSGVPDCPKVPCYAHSVLTGEQHAQFEVKLRKELAERAITEAAEGYASTLRGEAEQKKREQEWIEAEKKREAEADIEFEAYCKAKTLVWPKMRKCAKCREDPFNEPCLAHEADIQAICESIGLSARLNNSLTL